MYLVRLVCGAAAVTALLMGQARPEGPVGRGRGPSRPAVVADPNAKPGRVEGRVVNAKTGEPMRKATVSLGGGGPRGGSPRAVMTEADGRFVFEAVEPGSYQLAAERTGYLRATYSASKSSRSTGVSVASGQSVTGLELKMMPHGVLAGKIVDADGEPLQGVQISAIRVNSLGGKLRAAPVEFGSTNDLGEYRVYRLPAGRYYLMASRSRRAGPEEKGRDGLRESYVDTYFPGATEMSGATVLELGAGQELGGLTFPLRRTPVYRVSGKVVNQPAGVRMTSLRVFLRGGDRDTLQMVGPGLSGGVREDGRFAIDGVQPGQYVLSSLAMDREPVNLGSLRLTVGTSDVDEVTFPLGEPVTVTGTVRMESGELLAAGSARVQLAVTNPMFGARKETQLKADGTFRIERASRETAYVTIAGLAAGNWIKSVKMGGQELALGLVDLGSGGGLMQLEVVVSDRVGVVEGVVSVDGKAASEGMVTLAPEPYPVGRADLVRTATIGEDGGFRLDGVPPGDYRVYAWEAMEREMYTDPELLKKFEAASVKVSVKENATARAELKVSRAGQP
ncbi:MAG: carboxypeptidase regulatory-like domain-containing protein [Acidobacteria bacterium]|nr:carboxypeptidase regulatory-like domain-containing protein [Acidobacteriota bacterium]